MNYVCDGIILLCLVWGIVRGFKKGLVMQIFSIVAVVLGIWGGFALAGQVEPYLSQHMSRLACSFVSFAIVFLCMMLLVILSGKLVTKLLDVIALGMINRLLGACFGLLVNALFLSILIVFVNRFNGQMHFLSDKTIAKTYLYKPIGNLSAIFPEKYFKIL